MVLALMGWGFDDFLCVPGFSVSLEDHVDLGLRVGPPWRAWNYTVSLKSRNAVAEVCYNHHYNGHLLQFAWNYLLDE